MILEDLRVSAEEFAGATGWTIKPEGACKGSACVPLPRGGEFDVRAAAERLGMALVHDEEAGLWALGPETLGGRTLISAEAPELVLDDLDGRQFQLSSLRGRKALVVAWAPY